MLNYWKTAVLLAATAGLIEAAHAQPGPGDGPGGGMNMMQMIDTDKDGKISLIEYTAMAQMRWARISQGADKVTLASLRPMQQGAFAGIAPAADGTVSKDAYEAAIPGKFKAADANGDGSLDQAEMMASMGRPAGGMGGMRRQGN
jgi:hypothetical protein